MHPLRTVAVPAYNRPEDLAIPLGTILSQDDEITQPRDHRPSDTQGVA
jgi:hypothetical protein